MLFRSFDVNAESKLEDMQGLEEIRIPLGTGIVGYTAATGEVVNIANAYEVSILNVSCFPALPCCVLWFCYSSSNAAWLSVFISFVTWCVVLRSIFN